jgi:hypothetical protein
MGKVFISYRREETSGEARALYNDLVANLGKSLVFMDVDNIALGRDFRQVLQESLASCELMLVLIGREWVSVKNKSGRRRLEDPGDFIRMEIGAALKRNIPVTPVLLQGAKMPMSEELPEDLRDLSYRNGFELSHNRWESDVQEMIRRLGLGKQPAPEAPNRKGSPVTELRWNTLREKLTQRRVRRLGILALAIALTGVALLYLRNPFAKPTSTVTAEKPAATEPNPELKTKSPPPIEGRNDSPDRAASIVEGTTVRGAKVTDQDKYFFKFKATGAKTRLVLRKLNTRGFQAAVDVYDHADHKVAGQAESVVLVGSQDEPVTFSFESIAGEIYYIKLTIGEPAAEYELTVKTE